MLHIEEKEIQSVDFQQIALIHLPAKHTKRKSSYKEGHFLRLICRTGRKNDVGTTVMGGSN